MNRGVKVLGVGGFDLIKGQEETFLSESALQSVNPFSWHRRLCCLEFRTCLVERRSAVLGCQRDPCLPARRGSSATLGLGFRGF